MIFYAKYIKATLLPPADSPTENTAPRFRKHFSLPQAPVSATLHCAGLGIGYFYINGKPVSEDLFTAPASNYNKTVWYSSYDVTPLLNGGSNVLCAIVGNGFYNETHESTWGHNRVHWRDVPKLIAQLEVTLPDGEHFRLESDGTWRCTQQGPYLYNALRSGEVYDARLREPDWAEADFDDSAWSFAYEDPVPPLGVLRECTCVPIREFETYIAEKVLEVDGGYVFCFPQNISGYVKLRTGSLKSGQEITIRYAEDIDESGNLTYFSADPRTFYPGADYACNRFIANGEDFTWKPRFSYYGFRYVFVTGLTQAPEKDMVQAVFVHQAIPRKAQFACSDPKLMRLYKMGIYATWSNMFYMPTDCPTREKMGWTNDAQASTEQFLLDFQCEDVLRKWYQDIMDAMREDGEMPGVVPTCGWDYEDFYGMYYNGPTSSGVLFEIPWQIYRHTGKTDLLIDALPYFQRHLARLRFMARKTGFIDYGLCDWAGPWEACNASPVPAHCTNTLLQIKFLRITALAQTFAGQDPKQTLLEEQDVTKRFLETYFREDGRMIYHEQCSLSMSLVLDVYPNREVIEQQLVEVLQRDRCHLSCGMLGVQYLYDALVKAGRPDLAWAVLNAEDFPSYLSWITERDATTFCETFDVDNSQNHHMFTCVLAWMLKTLSGVHPTEPGYANCRIAPWLPDSLTWSDVSIDVPQGTVRVRWEKQEGAVQLQITLPEGMQAQLDLYGETTALTAGENTVVRNLQ